VAGPDARVSAPLAWDEVEACDPADSTLVSMPDRFRDVGDRHEGIDRSAGSLDALLELSDSTRARDWATHRGRLTTGSGRASRRACNRRSVAGSRKHPLIEIARARKKEDALAGLDRWKARHPKAASRLEPADVLVDAMRGRYSTRTRSGST